MKNRKKAVVAIVAAV